MTTPIIHTEETLARLESELVAARRARSYMKATGSVEATYSDGDDGPSVTFRRT